MPHSYGKLHARVTENLTTNGNTAISLIQLQRALEQSATHALPASLLQKALLNNAQFCGTLAERINLENQKNLQLLESFP